MVFAVVAVLVVVDIIHIAYSYHKPDNNLHMIYLRYVIIIHHSLPFFLNIFKGENECDTLYIARVVLSLVSFYSSGVTYGSFHINNAQQNMKLHQTQLRKSSFPINTYTSLCNKLFNIVKM